MMFPLSLAYGAGIATGLFLAVWGVYRGWWEGDKRASASTGLCGRSALARETWRTQPRFNGRFAKAATLHDYPPAWPTPAWMDGRALTEAEWAEVEKGINR